MKALSVRQPWAHLIVHGPKRVENRTRNCLYRSEVAIHSSKGMTQTEFHDAAHFAASLGWRFDGSAIHLGAIVGVATIIDCLAPGERRSVQMRVGNPPIDFRWWDRGQYGICLADVRALKEPVPCLGSLAMPWTVPPDIERQVREQLIPAVPAVPVSSCSSVDGKAWPLHGSPIDGRRP